ncbi:hypothetical protein EGH10_20995 [Brevibacillus laterosporus]|uniref:Fibronectin type-III domain-containing protein n=1 Tax=Brevibacillus laterosporus LMG 15441 TaxID=1042163 RepID=A0A075R4D9_BRELA|nr:hypothetical protein [Brevibacillus laterosporus]AIG27407.1 hypothetical protein BRLA_c030950 [Brevibacillus laterosporus LMG 15441]RJL15339.1 hypothetical protein DM460_00120 [Brevibacillus laterosporus]TPH06497.1 hypothetical protein EGH10_20995 [Brevibacillus laterosporus]
MDSKITIPYKWSFNKDQRTQTVTLKKGDLIVGFIRSSNSGEKFEITSSQGGISLLRSSAYNTGGNVVDSVSAVIYLTTTDMNTTLTFHALQHPTNLDFAITAIFRNAKLVAFDSLGHLKGSPEQTLPTNKSNGMGILLLNRYTPNQKTESYTVTLDAGGSFGPTMLTLDNIQKQDAMPPTISYNGGDYSSIVAILLDPAIIGPNKPTNLSPSGSSSSPAMVGSNPTFAWSYSSPDAGSTQKAYQLEFRKKINDGTIYATGKIISGSSTFTIPEGYLQPDTEYYYVVRVWDQYDNLSLESDRQYLKIYKAPTATPISPVGSRDKPRGASLAPTLKWDYYDPQGFNQYSFEIRITKKSDDSLVKTPGLVITSKNQYDVPLGDLEAGEVYYWSVRVQSEKHIKPLTATPAQYFITNTPPSAPTLTLPVATYRTSANPIFEAIAGSDPENDKQSFVIKIASDEQFTQDIRYYNSEFNYKNWSYYDGHEWKVFED